MYCHGFFWGVLGGALPEFYAVYKLRHEFASKRPPHIKSPFYWITTLAMIILGGGVVVFYWMSGTQLTPMLAIHLGLGTPTIIGGLVKDKAPSIEEAAA